MKTGATRCPLALVLALASSLAVAIDPTAPPRVSPQAGTAADGAQQAELAWVRVNGRQSIAWFGGTTVRLGDAVEGGRVSAIGEDHIVISSKGGSRSVYLLERTIRGARR